MNKVTRAFRYYLRLMAKITAIILVVVSLLFLWPSLFTMIAIYGFKKRAEPELTTEEEWGAYILVVSSSVAWWFFLAMLYTIYTGA